MCVVQYRLGCWLLVAAELGEFGFTCHSTEERALHKYLLAREGGQTQGDGTLDRTLIHVHIRSAHMRCIPYSPSLGLTFEVWG